MKRRGLTPDEHALWRRAIRDVAPIRDQDNLAGAPGLVPTTGGAVVPVSRRPSAPALGQKKTLGRHPHDPFSAGDPKLDRHARRGRIEIDATFDLHGHNQVSARAALYGFILEARSRGHRCVLVITGKGAPGAAAPAARMGRGVLRARFREWLCEDAFRQHIVRAAPAHPRHGGGGAFYVFLKGTQRIRR